MIFFKNIFMLNSDTFKTSLLLILYKKAWIILYKCISQTFQIFEERITSTTKILAHMNQKCLWWSLLLPHWIFFILFHKLIYIFSFPSDSSWRERLCVISQKLLTQNCLSLYIFFCLSVIETCTNRFNNKQKHRHCHENVDWSKLGFGVLALFNWTKLNIINWTEIRSLYYMYTLRGMY